MDAVATAWYPERIPEMKTDAYTGCRGVGRIVAKIMHGQMHCQAKAQHCRLFPDELQLGFLAFTGC